MINPFHRLSKSILITNKNKDCLIELHLKMLCLSNTLLFAIVKGVNSKVISIFP